MQLRPYQQELKTAIYTAWDEGHANVLGVSATGSGKTVTFSDVVKDERGASCTIAHRQELVTQISLALARDEVPHRIIGPKSVIKLAVRLHMDEIGVSLYEPNAPAAVAGVDTLIRRGPQLSDWTRSVRLWVQDEAHHLLRANKWGKAVAMFPNARGLGVTATPTRADNKALGIQADGVFHHMVEGPPMRWLIDNGYLTDYQIFAPPSDIRREELAVSATTGDFNPAKLRAAIRKSQIVGDVVEHYLKLARGKLGVTFVTDIKTAQEVAAQYSAQGIPAAAIHSKTPDTERVGLLRRFRDREILQLVNVDIFGEGFDLPAIEVVSMARPTESFSLYAQQFGRGLRLMDGKDRAIIIDHVGNVVRHGLPDAPRTWSLERTTERRGSGGGAAGIPVRACDNVTCMAIYERIYSRCPYCGEPYQPAGRSLPEQVDGDLIELDAATLASMRGAVDRVDMDPDLYRAELMGKRAPAIGVAANVKRHINRQEIQAALRESIGWWAAFQRDLGRPDSESYRRFYFKFGVDMLTAQALNTPEAIALATRINHDIGRLSTYETT